MRMYFAMKEFVDAVFNALTVILIDGYISVSGLDVVFINTTLNGLLSTNSRTHESNLIHFHSEQFRSIQDFDNPAQITSEQ